MVACALFMGVSMCQCEPGVVHVSQSTTQHPCHKITPQPIDNSHLTTCIVSVSTFLMPDDHSSGNQQFTPQRSWECVIIWSGLVFTMMFTMVFTPHYWRAKIPF